MSRLRMALLSFMVAAFAVGALVWRQMDELSKVETAVFETAMPSLQLNQQINKHMTGVIAYASEMAGNVPRDRMPILYESIRAEKQHFFNALQEAPADTSMRSLRKDALRQFSDIDVATEEMFALVETRNTILDNNAARIKELAYIQSIFALASEVHYLESSSRLVASVHNPNLDRSELQKSITDYSTYNEIEAGILQLFVLTESLTEVDGRDALLKLTNRIQFMTQKVAQNLHVRSDSETKSKLAKTVEDLRSITGGSTGLLSNMTELLQIEDQRTTLSERILQIVADISTIQENAIAATESTMSGVGLILERTIAQTMLICLLGVIVILLPVIAINQFVLKRQIGDRMKHLTTTVEKIAAGELKTPVDTSGGDEISTIARALEKFKSSAQELARSNADLERFAYVASHDMRAPLQSIHNLASWTMEDSGPELTQENRNNLALLISRVGRMRRLSNDLLLYAKLNDTSHQIVRFSCSEIVEDAIDLVAAGTGFTFKRDIRVDTVIGPVTPVRQILHNLVANAIKHHDHPPGEVSIVVKSQNHCLKVFVQDDGPGVPMEFHGQILEPFKTLQSRDDTEGSGMGLAIVSRLIQNFEGKFEIHSDPKIGRGTMCTFELPLAGFEDRENEKLSA